MQELGDYDVIEISRRMLKGSNVVTLGSLLRSKKLDCQDQDFEGMASQLSSREGHVKLSSDNLLRGVLPAEDTLNWLFGALHKVLAKEDLCKALFFYQESIRIFRFVEPVNELELNFLEEIRVEEIEDYVVSDRRRDFGPQFGPYAVHLELSFLSAYKALEVISGYRGPHRGLLKKWELDPKAEMWYPALGKMSFEESIRLFKEVRNNIAHGTSPTKNRVLYGQLHAAQECARHMLCQVLNLPFADQTDWNY